MKKYLSLLFILLSSNLHAIEVSVSIKPLHSIVSMVAKDIFTPILIITTPTSPHNFELKFKQITAIKKSNIVFIADTILETPIAKIVKQTKKIQLIEFSKLGNIPLYKFSSLSFQKLTSSENHKHHKHHNRHYSEHDIDYHVWLDPIYMKKAIFEVAKVLAMNDPTNQTKYYSNAKFYAAKLADLHTEYVKSLKPFTKKNFMVYHNGWQYLEKRYNLSNKGAILTNHADHDSPFNLNTKTLITLQNYTKNENIKCIFKEVQFKDKALDAYIEKNNIKTGILDPIGDNIPIGINLYITLMKNNLQSLIFCLS